MAFVTATAPKAASRSVWIRVWRILGGLVFIGILIGGWQLTISLGHIKSYLLPGPVGVWKAFVDNFGFLWKSCVVTLEEALAGFTISIVIGVGLAILVVYSRLLRRVILPSLVAVNATPKVAVAPILILWLGLGINSKIGMSFLLSFFPIVINAARGLSDVDPELLDYFRLIRANGLQTFTKARLPNSLPALFDGFKIALPIAIVGAVIGEFVASQNGIGYQIILAYSSFNTELVFAAVIFIAVVSTILFEALVGLERVLLRWRPAEQRRGA
jgi:NitT/TauT family transport system permease protein